MTGIEYGVHYDLVADHQKMTRVVKEQVELLYDALDALRHNAPHVTDEFLMRAIKHLEEVK